ncbi:hypothetical protein KCP76_15520 [Salmonella enterica subsp. enterica serovar Weltevreden]|nr:hypothetical protein KCP76_15520 [Salmonella enterica subsp. enterica serovar Weltevreden]
MRTNVVEKIAGCSTLIVHQSDTGAYYQHHTSRTAGKSTARTSIIHFITIGDQPCRYWRVFVKVPPGTPNFLAGD